MKFGGRCSLRIFSHSSSCSEFRHQNSPELLKVTCWALEVERLSPHRNSMRGTWKEESYAEDSWRHIMECSGNRAFFYRAPWGEPMALSKVGLGQYTYCTRLLSSNRAQSRVVISVLTWYNALRRHLYIMRLIEIPLYSRCGAEVETKVHILCDWDALATHRHTYLGSFFLDPEDVRSLSLGSIWNFSKGIGLPWHGHQFNWHKRPVKVCVCIGTGRAWTHIFYPWQW